MTGPEHYTEAELLVTQARSADCDRAAAMVAEAQVHATLALTAAVAMRGEMRDQDAAAWDRVAS